MTMAVEETRLRNLLKRVETVEDVANTLDEGDERRARLLEVTRADLQDGDPVRPVLAARLLQLSEKTVRAWVDAGVLRAASEHPRLLLDLVSVHTVIHLVNEVRNGGRERDLLDAVWHRLADQAVLDREDLAENLDQMRRGQGRVLRPKPE
jgi:hypothetical protein